jgi:NitT/TauT family transport system substrate-binding protein
MKAFRTAALVLLMTWGLAACASAPAPTPTPAPLDKTSIQLSWIHTIEYAGLYEAVRQDYYANASLNVRLDAGGFDSKGEYINPVQRVLDGKDDFGITDGGALLLARAGGSPVVAIAAIYQRSPVAFISLPEKGIRKPQDLAGHTVSIDMNGSGPGFKALLASQSIDLQSVHLVERTDFTTDLLLNGSADVIDGWVTNEGVSMTLANHLYNALLLSDYGIEIYANVIFTRQDMIDQHPDLVERFLRATTQGIQTAVDRPAEAATLAVRYNSERDLKAETEAMTRSIPLLNPTGSLPGMMSADVWKNTEQIFLQQGLLTKPLDIDKAYTLDFLKRIYGK